MTSHFPPNLGLLDQMAALKWIQKEIQNFGGDPSRVTIAGQGTGATMVSLHTYSHLSTDLFSQAILQSGTALVPFALCGNRYFLQTSKMMATNLKCISSQEWESKKFSEEFVKCIKEAPPEKIWNTYLQTVSSETSDRRFQYPWAPVVDGRNGFLRKHPAALTHSWTQNKKFLLGATHDEKANLVVPALLNGELGIQNYTESKLNWILGLLARPEAFPGKFGVISDLIKFAYTKNSFHPLGKNNYLGWINSMVEAASDYWINAWVAEEAKKLKRSNSSVYLYSFDYVPKEAFTHSQYYNGVMHGIDLIFLFPNIHQSLIERIGLKPWNFTHYDKKMSELIQTLWTNFVKTGDPNQPEQILQNPVWQETGPGGESQNYLSLDLKPRMRGHFHQMGSYLWNHLIPLLVSLPYNDFVSETSVAETNNLNVCQKKLQSQDLDGGLQPANPYFAATWALLGFCIVMLLTLVYTTFLYRQKLHSYDLLRRVEELSFDL